jgi:hypothetical protein
MPTANISFSDEIHEFLKGRQCTNRQRSEIVSSIVCRYRELLRQFRPDYSEENWQRIFDALAWVRGNRPAACAINEAITYIRLQLQPDSELGRELAALPWPSKLAVVDAAEDGHR